jgi:hypothetical protein
MPEHVECANCGERLLAFVLEEKILPVGRDACPHCTGEDFVPLE